MGLEKTMGPRAATQAQKTVATPEEREYREQLITHYRERLAQIDRPDADAQTFMEVVTSSITLSHHLLALGKEREANTIRKSAIKRLLTKAEGEEADAFSLDGELPGLQEKFISLRERFKEANATKNEMIKADQQRQATFESLSPEEQEAQREEFAAAQTAFMAESTEFQNNVLNPILLEGKPLENEINQKSQSIQQLINQSLYMKQGAVSLMTELQDSHGAFKLALDTLKKYHDNGFYGTAEGLVLSALQINDTHIDLLQKSGDHHDVHKLQEMGVEYALDAAQMIEQSVKDGIATPDLLSFAVQFRQFAATISAKTDNMDDVNEMLVVKAQEYSDNGNALFGKSLLLSAAEIFHQKAHELIEGRRNDEALKLLNQAIAIKSTIAQDIENKVLSQPQAVSDPQKDQMAALMAQMGMGGQQAQQEPTIDDALALRRDLIHLYLITERFEEVHEMLKSTAEQYKAAGYESAQIMLLEMGAQVATGQRSRLHSLRRDREPLPTGQYL